MDYKHTAVMHQGQQLIKCYHALKLTSVTANSPIRGTGQNVCPHCADAEAVQDLIRRVNRLEDREVSRWQEKEIG